MYYIFADNPAVCFTEIPPEGGFSVKYRYKYRGFRGCPLTRFETHCDFRILQFLSERNMFICLWRNDMRRDIIEGLKESENLKFGFC